MDPIVPRHTLDYMLSQDRIKPALLVRLRQRLGSSKLESSAERAEGGEDAEPTADSRPSSLSAPSLHKSPSRSGRQAGFETAPDSGGEPSSRRKMPSDVKRSSSIRAPALQNVDHQQPRPSPKPSLLDLPRELRDMIFEWLYSDWSVGGAKSLALLRTCRQLYHEASKVAFERALFRIHTEHWPNPEHFRARHLARIAPDARAAIRHLALRLPRGMPHDRYASARLDTDLAGLGFRLTSLVVFSHLPRPLPHVSVYGGVLESSLCAWLKQALYAMPSLRHVCILNYESATPTLHDMPSPRLIRMLRGSIFEDVMADCETWTEQNFEWRCLTDSLESSMSNCTPDEKTYRLYSSKLARSVEIVFRSEKFLPHYGLAHLATDPQDESSLPAAMREPMIHLDCPARILAQKSSIPWCKRWPSEQILQRAWPRRSGDADAQSKILGSDAMTTRMRSLGRRLSLSR
ncbi:uncharacterized protein PV09_05717 [Verruconis gallopava]|uniref:Uncharacterized protein n=1 Tax=Verruconis gallopava TaxID=253628 RepID=A0A0D1XL39_9PEZI|nr:uncharacterized protein PV09_05717 [Verruconis gallopava]KIW03071.1 hypothetical protein PV09_05717 [Verruconis gallopava]